METLGLKRVEIKSLWIEGEASLWYIDRIRISRGVVDFDAAMLLPVEAEHAGSRIQVDWEELRADWELHQQACFILFMNDYAKAA